MFSTGPLLLSKNVFDRPISIGAWQSGASDPCATNAAAGLPQAQNTRRRKRTPPDPESRGKPAPAKASPQRGAEPQWEPGNPTQPTDPSRAVERQTERRTSPRVSAKMAAKVIPSRNRVSRQQPDSPRPHRRSLPPKYATTKTQTTRPRRPWGARTGESEPSAGGRTPVEAREADATH